MTNTKPKEMSQFARTLTNSVAVVSHVWKQIEALKSLVESELPKAIDNNKALGLKIVDDGEEDAWDASDSLCVSWLWRYVLTRAPNGGAKESGSR